MDDFFDDMDGFDLLGADDDEIGATTYPAFDNSKSFSAGDIVTFEAQWWQATRDVSPPLIPWLMSGDKPGSSDAWRALSSAEVLSKVVTGVGDAVVTMPTVGADYTDAKTVTAVQSALVKKGYDLGSTGPNSDGVDGEFGPKTKTAIKKLQGIVGEPTSGKIDEGVIMTLQVTPGVLPPGVTMAGRAAVQAQVALDAATAAEHADTPAQVQSAAQAAVDAADAAAPPPPPEVKQAAQKALVKAKAASTPAQVQAAAQDVSAAAKDVHAAVAPSFWKSPAWPGGLPRWEVGAIGGGGLVALGTLLAVVMGRGTVLPVRR